MLLTFLRRTRPCQSRRGWPVCFWGPFLLSRGCRRSKFFLGAGSLSDEEFLHLCSRNRLCSRARSRNISTWCRPRLSGFGYYRTGWGLRLPSRGLGFRGCRLSSISNSPAKLIRKTISFLHSSAPLSEFPSAQWGGCSPNIQCSCCWVARLSHRPNLSYWVWNLRALEESAPL